jgi:hypothetical protein
VSKISLEIQTPLFKTNPKFDIDELLPRLKQTNAGCFVGRKFHAVYVDDVTLLAPTLQAMRIMPPTCEEFATEFSASFNVKKTKCPLFNCHKSRYIAIIQYSI